MVVFNKIFYYENIWLNIQKKHIKHITKINNIKQHLVTKKQLYASRIEWIMKNVQPVLFMLTEMVFSHLKWNKNEIKYNYKPRWET